MKLLSIQVGLPKKLDPEGGKPWVSGFWKKPVSGPLALDWENLAGDGQGDRIHHGGPDKAVCVYPKDHWDSWRKVLGPDLFPGAFGENFTTLGATEGEVFLGDIYQCGSAVVQVSQPRQPCWKLARRWGVKDLALQVERSGRTGWYLRVLTRGQVEAPQNLQLRERPHPEWSVAGANAVMHHHKTDWEAARALADCPALSGSWRRTLLARATSRVVADTALRQLGSSGDRMKPEGD